MGEGTFGKVKLGKHILTGEKVNYNKIVFKFAMVIGSSKNIREG